MAGLGALGLGHLADRLAGDHLVGAGRFVDVRLVGAVASGRAWVAASALLGDPLEVDSFGTWRGQGLPFCEAQRGS